jgi:heparan-alpha-glucosaminide N-acetyltransferase
LTGAAAADDNPLALRHVRHLHLDEDAMSPIAVDPPVETKPFPLARPREILDYASPPEPAPPPARLVSLDAYRGLVMALMVSAGLRIGDVVHNFQTMPGLAARQTRLWDRLAYQTDHSPWAGCSLWDLIQPSFMFLVGAALAFSVASRRAKGQDFARQLLHAIIRSLVLVLLAVVLTSNWSARPDWIFTNVLAQIGLGYTFLFLLAWQKPRWQLTAFFTILVLYWAAFALYSKPSAELDLAKVHLPANWDRLSGFASHWEKNTNAAARFDQWFLNLFPQASGKPFDFNHGGYQTLNFIPSLATMLLGLMAGGLVRSRLSWSQKFLVMLALGVVGLYVGWRLGEWGVCPVVKRIWTPSWVIFSGGWAFLTLAFLYLIIDVVKLRLWAMPLVVVGMNSIAVYCISMLLKPWFRENMKRYFTADVFNLAGKAYAPMLDAGFFLLFCWLVCWWMYRQKLFVKI